MSKRTDTASSVLEGESLGGQRMVISGGAGGIGLAAARALAAKGAHIITLARNADAASQAAAAIGHGATGVPCDLADLASVDRAARAIAGGHGPIDVVIANAGIGNLRERQVRHGVEMQFLVNHLAHFLLVDRLSPALRDGTGRIVVTSSSASVSQAPREGIEFENLDGARGYRASTFYGQSKLANALFARSLAGKLAARGIVANSLHPGAVAHTGFNKSLKFPLSMILRLATPFMKTPEQGAATIALLAGSSRVKGQTGLYWVDGMQAEGSRFLKDGALAQRLWASSRTILEREGFATTL
jgi:Dehydrogenases with different specificities (related to short-chain alcohol dehydrogenases)